MGGGAWPWGARGRGPRARAWVRQGLRGPFAAGASPRTWGEGSPEPRAPGARSAWRPRRRRRSEWLRGRRPVTWRRRPGLCVPCGCGGRQAPPRPPAPLAPLPPAPLQVASPNLSPSYPRSGPGTGLCSPRGVSGAGDASLWWVDGTLCCAWSPPPFLAPQRRFLREVERRVLGVTRVRPPVSVNRFSRELPSQGRLQVSYQEFPVLSSSCVRGSAAGKDGGLGVEAGAWRRGPIGGLARRSGAQWAQRGAVGRSGVQWGAAGWAGVPG